MEDETPAAVWEISFTDGTFYVETVLASGNRLGKSTLLSNDPWRLIADATTRGVHVNVTLTPEAQDTMALMDIPTHVQEQLAASKLLGIPKIKQEEA